MRTSPRTSPRLSSGAGPVLAAAAVEKAATREDKEEKRTKGPWTPDEDVG